MEHLYLSGQNGKQPINPSTAHKYRLEKGGVSPFTREKITDQNGQAPRDAPRTKSMELSAKQRAQATDAVDGPMLQPSEIIDFWDAPDSSDG